MKIFVRSLAALLLIISVCKAQVNLPPVLNSPLNGAINVTLTPDLNWTFVPVIGIFSSYRLQISANSNFNTIIFDRDSIANDNFIIPSGILQNNTQYYWRVNAAFHIGILHFTTEFSQPFMFRTMAVTGIQHVTSLAPESYNLYVNYPNPFNPSTKIKFDIKTAGDAKLSVFDISGKEVTNYNYSNLNPGSYEVVWSAGNFSSGIYFYRLESGSFVQTKKMILSK